MKILTIFLVFCGLVMGQTAQFPGAVATDQNLFKGYNPVFPVMNLVVAMGSTDTSFTVNTCGNLATNGLVSIDQEEIAVSSCSIVGSYGVMVVSTTPTAGRGYNGTTATSHLPGHSIIQSWSTWFRNSDRVEIEAIETALGVNLSNVASGVFNVKANTNLVYVGDSLLTTSGEGSALPAYIYTRSSGTITNVAVPGSTCEQSLAAYSGVVAPLYNSGASVNLIYLMSGTNSLSTDTPAQAFACLQSYALAAHATGFKLVVSTIEDRSTLDWTTKTNPTNNLIRANIGTGTTFFNDVSDIAGPSIIPTLLGCNGCSLNTEQFITDNTHNTEHAKRDILAPIAASAISRVYGVVPILIPNGPTGMCGLTGTSHKNIALGCGPPVDYGSGEAPEFDFDPTSRAYGLDTPNPTQKMHIRSGGPTFYSAQSRDFNATAGFDIQDAEGGVQGDFYHSPGRVGPSIATFGGGESIYYDTPNKQVLKLFNWMDGCSSTASNPICGTTTLVSGTKTISTTSITATSIVKFSLQNCINCSTISLGTVVAGTSFVINSKDVTDGSKVYWEISNDNP